MNKKSKVLVYKPKTKIVVPSDITEEYLKHHQKKIAREINKWCWEQMMSQGVVAEVLEVNEVTFSQKEKLPLNQKLKLKKVGPISVLGFDDEEPFIDEGKSIEDEEKKDTRTRYLSDEEMDIIEY